MLTELKMRRNAMAGKTCRVP